MSLFDDATTDTAQPSEVTFGEPVIEIVFRPNLMEAFLRLIGPSTGRSRRFIPPGVTRNGYRPMPRPQPATRKAEKVPALYGGPRFLKDGVDLIGLPLQSHTLLWDPYLRRGDLLGVYLLEDGRLSTLGVTFNSQHVSDGKLAKAVVVLQQEGVRFLLGRGAGEEVQVWIPFLKQVRSSKAKAWLTKILLAAGLKPRRDFTSILPQKEGDVLIPPHFRPDGTSSLLRLVDSRLEVIADEEVLDCISSFEQEQSVLEQLQDGEGERSKKPVDLHEDNPNLRSACGLKFSTEVEKEQEVRSIRLAVEMNHHLCKLLEEAEAAKTTTEKRIAIREVVHSLVLEHLSHPEAVLEAVSLLLKKGKTLLEEELFRLVKDGRASSFIYRSSRFRFATAEVSQVDNGRSSSKIHSLEADPSFKLEIIDSPPGSGKSTQEIPVKAIEITRSGGKVLILRERREDCLRTSRLINSVAVAPLEDLRAELIINREGIPSPSPEDYRNVLHGPLAAPTFSYTGIDAHCVLANGDESSRRRLKPLKDKAKKEASSPCKSGCEVIACVQHPGRLNYVEKEVPGTSITVATHSRNFDDEGWAAALVDERPQQVVRCRSILVARDGRSFSVSLIDPIKALLEALGITSYRKMFDDCRKVLVDVFQQVEKTAEANADLYRIYRPPALGLTDKTVEEILEGIKHSAKGNDRGWAAAVKVAKKYPVRKGHGLREQIRADLQDLAMLFSPGDVLWRWSANDSEPGLRLHRAAVDWSRYLQMAEHTYLYDGTAASHFAYAALSTNDSVTLHRAPRPEYPNLQILFGDDRIAKGRGTERLDAQVLFTVERLKRLQAVGFRGDVLVITHDKAKTSGANSLVEQLRASPVVEGRWSVFSAEDPAADSEHGPRIWVAHFGAFKGSNKFAACHAVIVTHIHSLPYDDAVAIAFAMFPEMKVRLATGALVAPPRQWKSYRRGLKSGRNLDEPALFSQHFDAVLCPEVGFVLRSHVATEAVQGILRSRVRTDPAAPVLVFIPTGHDTALEAMIVRELPGAVYDVGTVMPEMMREDTSEALPGGPAPFPPAPTPRPPSELERLVEELVVAMLEQAGTRGQPAQEVARDFVDGLRLNEGLELEATRHDFGRGPAYDRDAHYRETAEAVVTREWGRYRLANRGRLAASR